MVLVPARWNPSRAFLSRHSLRFTKKTHRMRVIRRELNRQRTTRKGIRLRSLGDQKSSWTGVVYRQV